MKLADITAMSALFLAACAHTTTDSKASADQVSKAELIALDEAWIAAEVGQDRTALERILDDRFLATLTSGKTVDRSAFLDSIMSAQIKPFQVVHDVIQIHGDTALVIDLSETGAAKYTWIAVKRDGRWRVISETFSSGQPR